MTAASVDTDGDGESDGVLVDEDGDGIYEGADTNGDGTADISIDELAAAGAKIDLDGDGTYDGAIIDSDGDGIADGLDTDGDGSSDVSIENLAAAVDGDTLTDAESVSDDAAKCAPILSGSDTTGGITQSITLPTTGDNGTTIIWTSSLPAIIAVDGTVTRPSYISGDATVTLTATITKNGVSETKTFTVTVKKSPQSAAEAVTEDTTNLAIAYSGTDSNGSVTQNISLPASGSNGTTITWSSSNTAVIATDGTVTRPAFTSGDATVTLSATITKNGVSETKIFTLTVKRQPATAAEVVAEDKTNLVIAFGGTDSTGSVTQNLTLPTSGSNGTTISWESSNASIVAANGTVTRPTYGSGEESTVSVTLTATITKNGVSETKTFTLTVKKISTNAMLSALAVGKGKLQPSFSSSTTSYLDAPVPFSSNANPAYNDTQSVTITPTANSGATITINGTSVPSGSSFTMDNLAIGSNSATIVVTAEDGVTTKTYSVDVYRAIPIFKTGASVISGYTLDPREDGATQRGVSWPATRFTAVGTDSIKDEMTGLVWLKSPDATERNFADAITWCESLSNTYSDWRMPNVRELRSLVHYGKAAPFTWLNTAAQGFTNVQDNYYWSSTTYAFDTSGAWRVIMSNGVVGNSNKTSNSLYVWPVRSGQ